MTEEFYINYRRDIEMYSQRIQNFIDNGCESKSVIERWIKNVKDLQDKKKVYDDVLNKELDGLNHDFDILKLQSNELTVRKNMAQIKMTA